MINKSLRDSQESQEKDGGMMNALVTFVVICLAVIMALSMALVCVDAAWSAIRELKGKIRGGNV